MSRRTRTSGESSLIHGRIAVAHGRFSRIRQVAPMCRPMWTHWRNLANKVELVLPLAHRSPHPKQQIDRKSIASAVSAQLTAESPSTLQWATLSPKIAPSHGDLDPHLIHDSLREFEPTIQTASRSVQPFSHR